RGRQVVAAAAGVGLLVPMVATVQLFPYSYAYVNSLATAGFDPPGDFSLPPDDYRASMREHVGTLGPGEFVVCSPEVDDRGRPLRKVAFGGQPWLDLAQDCAHPRSGLLAPYREPG